jgi:hypothetical protein
VPVWEKDLTFFLTLEARIALVSNDGLLNLYQSRAGLVPKLKDIFDQRDLLPEMERSRGTFIIRPGLRKVSFAASSGTSTRGYEGEQIHTSIIGSLPRKHAKSQQLVT